MALEAQEKRRFPRVKLKAPLRYQIRGTSKPNHALSDDISLGGMSLVNDQFIAPQTLIGLEFSLFSKVLSPVGKIAWSSPMPHSDRYRTGIEFLEMDAQQKNFLLDYIDIQTNRL